MLLFNSTYFVFLAAVFLVYWPLARWRAASLAVLLFANYFFYARWDLVYLFVIPAASSCDFLIGLGLERTESRPVRRLLVGLSVALNLAILGSFKYRFLPGQWLFPLGLSFYAFQALTYTIDVYRRDAKATHSYLAHLTAVSFFPTIISGPITRVADLLVQFERKTKALAASDSGRALFLICLGLVKKLLIADSLADNLVNRVFDFPKLYSGAEVLVGVYAYALQLFCDFSGYTDIALGSALLLGLKLPANFKMPYAAVSITDFWRRWHISFSNWLRDYLYFSLPGLRSRWKIMPYVNLVITMLLGGLWHGATWNFAIWGLLHGFALAVARAWHAWRGTKDSGGVLSRCAWTFATVQFVCFAWIFFRAPTLETAGSILSRIGSMTFSLANVSTPVVVALASALLVHSIPATWQSKAEQGFASVPFYAQAAAMALVVWVIHYFAGASPAPFIYSRF